LGEKPLDPWDARFIIADVRVMEKSNGIMGRMIPKRKKGISRDVNSVEKKEQNGNCVLTTTEKNSEPMQM